MGRLTICLAIFTSCFLWSHPVGPVVSHGDATISHPSQHACHIHASDKAIINWQDFSIQSGELTRFIQPSESSVVLNRVIGNMPSQILGTLEANGTLLLLNQNGILFGKHSVVNVGALIASTLQLSDEHFLQGDALTFEGGRGKLIVHHGTISAKSGHVSLFSEQIISDGTIKAPEGNVELAAGATILLKPHDKKRILIRPSLKNPKNGTGIVHQGHIEAIQTHLQSDGNLYEYAIQNSGSIDALQVSEEGGAIFLRAENGSILQTGNLFAPGGEIQILGEEVIVKEEAHLCASHPTQPGNIYLGGTKHGTEPELYRSELTTVDHGVTLEANALDSGNGGNIICWSDGTTVFVGNAEVRGGPNGGDGGFVEVSGALQTRYLGQTDRFASQGNQGELLLDPESNFRISTRVSYNLDYLKEPTADIANLFVETLIEELEHGPVVIQTSFEGEGGTNGHILLDADVSHSYASPHTLTFQSTGSEGILWQGSLTNTSTGDIDLLASNGDILITPQHDKQAALLKTEGDIHLNAAGKVIVESNHGQNAWVQAAGKGNLSVESQAGVLLTSSKDAEASFQVDDGLLSVQTAGEMILHGKHGGLAQIHAGSKGRILFENLDGLKLLGESGPASILGELTIKHVENGVQLHAIDGPVEILTGDAPLILNGIMDDIDLIAENAPVSLISDGRLSLQNKGDVYLNAQQSPITIQSGDFLELNTGKSIVLAADQANVSIFSPIGLHFHAQEDLYLYGTLMGKTSIDSPNAKLFVGRDLTLYSHACISGKNGSLFISVGNDFAIENPLETPPPSIFAKQIHLNVSGNFGLSNQASIFTTGGALQISVGQNAYLNDSSSLTARGGALELTTLYGNIHLAGNTEVLSETDGMTFSAGKSILCEGFSHLKSRGEQGITLIADELNPNSPGNGGIVLGENASIDSKGAPLNLYTSKRENTSILGTMNGYRLTKAPHFMSTKEERWDTYYPAAPEKKDTPAVLFVAAKNDPSPFTVYHKETGLIETGSMSYDQWDFSRIVVNYIGPFTAEMFRDLHPYNEYTQDTIWFKIESPKEKTKDFSIKRRTFKHLTVPPINLGGSE